VKPGTDEWHPLLVRKREQGRQPTGRPGSVDKDDLPICEVLNAVYGRAYTARLVIRRWNDDGDRALPTLVWGFLVGHRLMPSRSVSAKPPQPPSSVTFYHTIMAELAGTEGGKTGLLQPTDADTRE